MKSKKKLIDGLFYSFIILAFIFTALRFSFQTEKRFRYDSVISKYSKEFNISKYELAAVIKVESDFCSSVVSRAGAVGLMQILPSTAEFIAESLHVTEYDLFSPATNIRFGAFYLSYLHSKFSNRLTVYAAYNAGETRVIAWLSDVEFSSDGVTLDVIPFEETELYVKKVVFYEKIYSRAKCN